MIQNQINQTIQPNLYELSCHDVQVTYSTTSISGVPQLSYQDCQKTLNFSGDEIRTAESEIGTLVTVTLNSSPDLQTETLTLLIPLINLTNQQDTAEIETMGIMTVAKTTIAGPNLIQGQVQTYFTLHLTGISRFVFF